MVFSYRAKSVGGQIVTGEVQSSTISGAADLLRKKKLVIISLRPVRNSLWRAFVLLIHTVKRDEVTAFTRQLSTMIAAGLPLTESLRILKAQSSMALSSIINSLMDDVEGGTNLAGALAKHPRVFPDVYVALIRAGEAGGALDTILLRLADNMERQKEFRGKVTAAMIYPSVVLSGMIIVSIVMMVLVIPRLTEIYQSFGTQLPLPTRMLIAVSSFVTKFWFLAIAIIGMVGTLVYSWLKTPTGREVFDTYLFRMPIFGQLRRNVILTEFSRTLGLLIGSGIPIIEGLSITANAVGNFLMREEVLSARAQVEKGLPLAVPLSQSEYFPPILAQMVSVGEETGKLEEVLTKLAVYFESESKQSVAALTAAIEPFIMIVLGVGVGFLVIGIILPIYTLTSSF